MPVADGLRAAQLDGRLLGMLGALAAIWLTLHAATDGVFLTPRNLYNLAVQSSVVAVMAAGMVLVIVSRHIDLSVGSVLGFVGMAMAWLQAEALAGAAWSAPLALGAGLALGAAIGAWNGFWVAYRGLPAFVVTLAGLLMFRGAAYLVTDGRTVSPLAPTWQLLGAGSIGARWSWVLGAGAVAVRIALALRSRAVRRAHDIPVRPLALEWPLLALQAAGILGFVAIVNAYTWPRSDVARGIPVPVLIAVGVTVVVAALARVTRFGRAVLAMGGDPEAAKLAGIDTRRVALGVFVLMGALAAVAAVITTARLGAGTSSMGTLAELSVIAAAVLGGTSLAGGAGSVGGAVLGAVIMQSLENGMLLLGVSSPVRQIAIGLVLIAAIQVDTLHRRRRR
ncbi:MAG: sugar ABC transporter permease [Myxococcota bacterium]|nr:sugar ABC transporter permease [Myxococcota bacterium]